MRVIAWLRGSYVKVGVAGALVVFVGIALLFAFEQPPFVAPDETAHVGYAHEIAGFDLPEITEHPDVPASATQWQAERDSARAERYLGVWVANHPPLHYVATAPLIWLSNAMDRPDGGLMFLRVANIAFATVGLWFTYLLGRDLGGGVRRIGVAAASLAALLPQGQVLFSQAMNDGLGFAATTAVAWAGVRCIRRGSEPLSGTDLFVLGAAATACAGARSATLAVAALVVMWVAATRLAQTTSKWHQRLAAAGIVLAAGLLPAAALFGWYYVRNRVLYGDFAGSEFLLDRFRRRPRGSVVEMLTDGDMWVRLYHHLFSPSTLRLRTPPGVDVAIVVAGVGVVLATVTRRTGDVVRRGVKGVVSRNTVALCVAIILVVMVTVAQHVSGGGSRYSRYLLPALGAAAALFALGFDRLWPRVLPAISVVLMGWWALRNVPSGVDPTRVRRPRDDGRMPELLQVLPASPWLRTTTGVVIAAGCLAVLAALGTGLLERRERA
jgi:hypothetical protein